MALIGGLVILFALGLAAASMGALTLRSAKATGSVNTLGGTAALVIGAVLAIASAVYVFEPLKAALAA